MSSSTIVNAGSNARDFCMLERNLLSHVKLALLLSLLSSSFLLRARLFPSHDDHGGRFDYEHLGLPLSTVLYAAAILTMIGGLWEFWSGHVDFRVERPFLSAPKPHLVLLTVVSAIVFGVCVTLLAAET